MYMAKYINDNFNRDHDLKFVFANTGMEDDRTIDFVNNCQINFGIQIIWVEADVNERGIGTSHKIVNYKTAKRWRDWRSGTPFEDVVKKYGLPNVSYLHCTRELKEAPMYSYIKSIGWDKGSFDVAIGIRADESERVSISADKRNLIYPLVDLNINKKHVIDFWASQNFDLEIKPEEEAFGNCLCCFKKTAWKLKTVDNIYPDVFAFSRFLEDKYKSAGSGGDRVMYRCNMSTDQILALGDDQIKSGKIKKYKTEQCEAFGCQLDIFEGI